MMTSRACNVCSIQFEKKEDLDYHIKMNHKENPLNYIDCTLCEERFNESTRLDYHMKIRHMESELGKQERKLMIATKATTTLIQDDISIMIGNDDEAKSDNGLNWEDVEDEEENNENDYKSYKIKYYTNSDGEQMGLTIKGKTKSHIESHKKVIEIMDRLPKTKEKDNTFGGTKIKVLEKPPKTPSLLTLKLEVTAPDNSVGTAELKLHKPAKKGSTLEIRKTSGDTFDTVEKLRDMIEKLFELLSSGQTVSKILAEARGRGTLSNQPLLKVLSCDKCDWQTKTRPALRAHITRLHSVMADKLKSNQFKCDFCEFASSPAELEGHKKEFHLVHQNMKKQSKDHSNLKRNRSVKSAKDISPPMSPPRKKAILETDNEMKTNIEMVDMSEKSTLEKVTNSDEVNINQMKKSYEKRITELEAIVKQLMDKSKMNCLKDISKDKKLNVEAMDTQDKLDDVKQSSTTENNVVQEKLVGQTKVESQKIPAPLESVHVEHIPQLKGFTKRLGGIADGACTTNCATAHIFHTRDKHERQKLKRRINNQIADNWDNFYVNKIALPYKETVGTGPERWTFEAHTKDDMIAFLRSDMSLKVFANSHDILALANHLNTNIEIFSYGIHEIKERCEWQQVQPDPAMESVAMFPKGFIETLYLYHSDDNHYDLLVNDDHKLVTEGLTVATIKVPEKVEAWTEVNYKTHTKQSKKEALKSMNLEVFEDEEKLVNSKSLGHKRTSPQNEAEPHEDNKPNQTIKCNFSLGTMHCTATLESQGLAEAHMKSHGVTKPNVYCDLCDEEFFNEQGLWTHNQNEHDTSRDSKQWNCNDCGFQSTTSTPLMNHCKDQGHQPSKTVQDGRGKLITCNNCQKDFTSFWNLMNHRKLEHPSNRKCRDFVKGECQRGDLCWYVHDNVMELGSQNPQKVQLQGVDKITCYVCKCEFSNKNDMMNHKKREHPSNIICKNFCLGNCRRSEDQCWYLHKILPGGVSSQYDNLNTLPQSRQASSAPWGSLPNGSQPSEGTVNLNKFSQSIQPCSTPQLSPPSAHPVGDREGGVSLTNLSPQSTQANITQGFPNPPSPPPPPEVPVTQVMMLQFTQMIQRMEQIEMNLHMILQQNSPQKSPST